MFEVPVLRYGFMFCLVVFAIYYTVTVIPAVLKDSPLPSVICSNSGKEAS